MYLWVRMWISIQSKVVVTAIQTKNEKKEDMTLVTLLVVTFVLYYITGLTVN